MLGDLFRGEGAEGESGAPVAAGPLDGERVFRAEAGEVDADDMLEAFEFPVRGVEGEEERALDGGEPASAGFDAFAGEDEEAASAVLVP